MGHIEALALRIQTAPCNKNPTFRKWKQMTGYVVRVSLNSHSSQTLSFAKCFSAHTFNYRVIFLTIIKENCSLLFLYFVAATKTPPRYLIDNSGKLSVAVKGYINFHKEQTCSLVEIYFSVSPSDGLFALIFLAQYLLISIKIILLQKMHNATDSLLSSSYIFSLSQWS